MGPRISRDRRPYCRWRDIYVSDPKTLSEEVATLLLLRPVRCHDCMQRFYRLLFVATPLVDAAESRKPVRQVGTDKKDNHRSA